MPTMNFNQLYFAKWKPHKKHKI